MLRLRPYKSCDSEKIARWITDRDVFLKWGGDHFGEYPVSADAIDEKYRLHNGDCKEPDNFYPWVTIDDENGTVGHFIMRYLHGDHRMIRFGWVIVDSAIRGKGYGAEMLRAGLRYAFEFLDADVVTIGVFETNERAHRCYRKVGFTDTGIIKKEPWNIIEMEIRKSDYRAESELEQH